MAAATRKTETGPGARSIVDAARVDSRIGAAIAPRRILGRGVLSCTIQRYLIAASRVAACIATRVTPRIASCITSRVSPRVAPGVAGSVAAAVGDLGVPAAGIRQRQIARIAADAGDADKAVPRAIVVDHTGKPLAVNAADPGQARKRQCDQNPKPDLAHGVTLAQREPPAQWPELPELPLARAAAACRPAAADAR
ncbi:MAG: hypothetical protein JXR83_04120 [Deltaproteobacteria bacterium]|nr:hypothetical protein [Deltaproteobacteria bacterium]